MVFLVLSGFDAASAIEIDCARRSLAAGRLLILLLGSIGKEEPILVSRRGELL